MELTLSSDITAVSRQLLVVQLFMSPWHAVDHSFPHREVYQPPLTCQSQLATLTTLPVMTLMLLTNDSLNLQKRDQCWGIKMSEVHAHFLVFLSPLMQRTLTFCGCGYYICISFSYRSPSFHVFNLDPCRWRQ